MTRRRPQTTTGMDALSVSRRHNISSSLSASSSTAAYCVWTFRIYSSLI